jgi:ABC-type transport system involved in multi-copper enzyme maturation permease subunit
MRTAFVMVLLGVAVAVLVGVFLRGDAEAMRRAPELGQMLFGIFAFLQFAIIVLLVPLLAAGAVVEERNERSLQLLILTDLNPWQIAVGKFLARFGIVSLILLSVVPVLSLVALLGGVEPLDAMRIFTLTLSVAALFLGLSLLLSSLASTTVGAATAAYTLLVAYLVFPPILYANNMADLAHWHIPTVLFFAVVEPLVVNDIWWHGVAASFAAAFGFVGLASLALRRSVRRTRVFTSGALGGPGRWATVWRNPIAWREWVRRGRPTLFWCITALIGSLLAALLAVLRQHEVEETSMMGLFILEFVALLWALAYGAGAFAQEKSEQTLDLLLLSRMRPWEVLLGKLAGVGRIGFGFALLTVPSLVLIALRSDDLMFALVAAVPITMIITMVFAASLAMFWSVYADSPLRAAYPSVAMLLYISLGLYLWPLLFLIDTHFSNDATVGFAVALGWLTIFGAVLWVLVQKRTQKLAPGIIIAAVWCVISVFAGLASGSDGWAPAAVHPFVLVGLSFLAFDRGNSSAWEAIETVVLGWSLLLLASGFFFWASTRLLAVRASLSHEDVDRPATAALWGALFPGAGHLYLGEVRRGLLLLLLSPFVACGLGLVNAWSAYDAHRIATERRMERRDRANARREEIAALTEKIRRRHGKEAPTDGA